MTKKERLEHYKKMLTYFEDDSFIDFCACSLAVGGISVFELPEIMEYEPKEHGLYWFYDITTRKNILKEIITKMKG